ncbi:putative inactive tRNA-specific adenosine deaminase-like protein 3 [Bagarius yarrelli]|uniref:Putative inactive tRNA-specific adenosine deaminase-like protein 3 n=1 Tax=Bagarius yarrelli TaxID=175774 RepID=A0A556TW78_BAGYA|nr:putative inactive tRNA-specific adenosine deaminase-like protein 3 [Bagarius yarrelli]
METLGAAIIDPKSGQILALGHSPSRDHPLQSAAMVCIDPVARGQGGAQTERFTNVPHQHSEDSSADLDIPQLKDLRMQWHGLNSKAKRREEKRREEKRREEKRREEKRREEKRREEKRREEKRREEKRREEKRREEKRREEKRRESLNYFPTSPQHSD